MFSCFCFVCSVKIISLILSQANQVGRTKVKDFGRKPSGHLQAECVFFFVFFLLQVVQVGFKLGQIQQRRTKSL